MSLDTTGPIRVEVVFAEPDRQRQLTLEVPPETTVAQAVDRAARRWRISLDTYPTGIFGESVPRTRRLQDADRVELYRPLVQDAKSARRARAESQKG